MILFIHGFSDHCNRYPELFHNLATRGILVHSFDQRGWGRSVKKTSDKGLTGPTTQVLADITSVIQKYLPCPVPFFLMGHSMGGQETLQYAAKGPQEVKNQISGFLAAAPYIRLHPSSEPNRLTVMVGKLAGKLLPKRQLFNALDSTYMCHDKEMCKSWEEDELCHDTGTLEGLAGMLARGDELDKGSVVIQDWEGCHIWLAHGTEDRVTSHEATKEFMKRLNVKDKTLTLYEGCYHCSTYCTTCLLSELLLTTGKFTLSQMARRGLLQMLQTGSLQEPRQTHRSQQAKTRRKANYEGNRM